MDWTAQIETNRNVLERIVALLLALADLADRAAGASYPVRLQVLWAFQLADDVARELVAGPAYGTAGCLQPPAPAPRCCGSDPADFANLAASLRMLALVVQFSPAFSPCGRRWPSRAQRVRGRMRGVGRNEACFDGRVWMRRRAPSITPHPARPSADPPSSTRGEGTAIRAPPRLPARPHRSLPSWPGRISPARRRSRRDTSSGAHARASARRPGCRGR